MQLKNMIPSLPEIGRETIIVLGGAVLAAFIVGQFPQFRQWMQDQWLDTPRTTPTP
jgi:hypothetical protein